MTQVIGQLESHHDPRARTFRQVDEATRCPLPHRITHRLELPTALSQFMECSALVRALSSLEDAEQPERRETFGDQRLGNALYASVSWHCTLERARKKLERFSRS